MDFLRRAAKTWVAKLLLILLVASFGVWGISGSLFATQSSTVVSVGDETIGPNEFLLAYNQTIGNVSQRIGRRLTTEEARAFGLEEQVFSNLATSAALSQQAADLNLGLSEKRQADIIAEEQIFHDRVTGQFDEATFRLVLRQVGMTESQYLENNAKTAIRQQIADAISDGVQAPQTLLKALSEYRTEKRDIDYIVVKRDLLDAIEAPSETVLSAYFEDNKATYAAPEFRKVSFVRLQAEDIIDLDAVSEESIAQEYEARISTYSTPEQRTIDQLRFADKAAAEAALSKLEAGMSFDDLATEEGKTASDISIGTFTKETMPDPSLANAAFAIAQDGGTSGVVEGTFGNFILRAKDIVEASTRTLADVQDEIRQNLALIAAADTLLDVHDAYEDDRASGMTLKEAADKQGLAVTTIDMIDANGLDNDGVAVEDIPQAGQLIAQAFESDIGLETLPINIGNDGFVWFEVQDIFPARDRTLEEVRSKAVADWTEGQTATALVDKATELKSRLDGGETLQTIADELSLSVEKKIELTRTGADAVFSAATISTAFGGPEGLTAIAKDATGENEVLMKVVAVTIPEVNLEEDVALQVAQSVSAANAEEIMSQMIAKIQNQYGVVVNRGLAQQALAHN
ncbi:MAG: SurA N-terminal domain-containing protein [Lentilitoribacter sp.]